MKPREVRVAIILFTQIRVKRAGIVVLIFPLSCPSRALPCWPVSHRSVPSLRVAALRWLPRLK